MEPKKAFKVVGPKGALKGMEPKRALEGMGPKIYLQPRELSGDPLLGQVANANLPRIPFQL